MNEAIIDIFRNNIIAYEKVKTVSEGTAPLKKETVSAIRAYFFIITSMREVYGCPACGADDRCSCKVITGISEHVNWRPGDDSYPSILW